MWCNASICHIVHDTLYFMMTLYNVCTCRKYMCVCVCMRVYDFVCVGLLEEGGRFSGQLPMILTCCSQSLWFLVHDPAGPLCRVLWSPCLWPQTITDVSTRVWLRGTAVPRNEKPQIWGVFRCECLQMPQVELRFLPFSACGQVSGETARDAFQPMVQSWSNQHKIIRTQTWGS